MSELSASSWVIMAIGCAIYFGGSLFTLLIAMGKDPREALAKTGIFDFMDRFGEKAEEAGIYRPFEYMDKGPKEKGMALAILLVLLTIAWQVGAFDEASEAGFGADSGPNFEIDMDGDWSHSDSTDEGDTTPVDHKFEDRVVWVNFTLTWTDDDTAEANVGGMGYQNQPDRFTLTIVTPNGTEYSETAENDVDSEEGIIEIAILLGMDEEEKEQERLKHFDVGNWNVNVTCDDAGDSSSPVGGIYATDSGNAWDLDVEYAFYEDTEDHGGILE